MTDPGLDLLSVAAKFLALFILSIFGCLFINSAYLLLGVYQMVTQALGSPGARKHFLPWGGDSPQLTLPEGENCSSEG